MEKLTEREKQVKKLMENGYYIDEIAKKLKIATNTASRHIYSCLHKEGMTGTIDFYCKRIKYLIKELKNKK